jgi:hypothetical protein
VLLLRTFAQISFISKTLYEIWNSAFERGKFIKYHEIGKTKSAVGAVLLKIGEEYYVK